MIEYDIFYPSKFIGKKTYCGFKHNKDYTLKVMDNKPYATFMIHILKLSVD